MRICYRDSERFRFRRTGTYAAAETSDVDEVAVRASLIVLLGVEENDDDRLKDIVDRCESETTALFDSLDTESIVLFPRPHIVRNPASLEVRTSLMRSLEDALISTYDDEHVYRIPEGHRGEVEILKRGHPMAAVKIDL